MFSSDSRGQSWLRLQQPLAHPVFITHAATAKSLQSCPILCAPIPGILQAKTLERVAISFSKA